MTAPRAFGVRLCSRLPFDRLPRAEAEDAAVIFEVERSQVLPGPETELENSYYAQGRRMEIYAGENTLRAVVTGMLCFDLSLATNHVRCIAQAEVADELVRYWFLQQILPILLLLNGSTELLHATAVALPGASPHSDPGAVCFLGRSGIGKSTLLNFFLEQGAALITDEHLVLNRNRIEYAVPSVPFYRPYRSLEDLGLRAERFAQRPVRVRRLYLLEPASPEASVSSEPLPDAEVIAAVMLNSQYSLGSPRRLQTRPILARRFHGLATLTRKVPVRRLRVPRSLHRLPDVYDFIQNEVLSEMEHGEGS
jgi:hypothetical protein